MNPSVELVLSFALLLTVIWLVRRSLLKDVADGNEAPGNDGWRRFS